MIIDCVIELVETYKITSSWYRVRYFLQGRIKL